MLQDSFGRHINYLRLAVTDRCNLRCMYCMPAGGLDWSPKGELLSFEEIERLLFIFKNLGITRLRFTGGEPFLRKDFMRLVEKISANRWFESISITTNGTLAAPFIPRLKELDIHSINLSLDTIDKDRFTAMTRRPDYDAVMNTFKQLIDLGIRTKINAVIMDGKNDDDIFHLSELTRTHHVDVRFIEEMPFNGLGKTKAIKWTDAHIIRQLKEYYPGLYKLVDEKSSTSSNYGIPGHNGNVGVIAAWSRSFCGTCNRVRLTPKGDMKTCLYDQGQFSLRDMMRHGQSDEDIRLAIVNAVGNKAINGHEAERMRMNQPVSESMATIGG